VLLQVVCGLLHKALQGPLLPSQQHTAMAHMDADPQLVFALQLQPQQLPALVEHTPLLAYQVLLRMVGSRRLQEFHEVWQTAARMLRALKQLLVGNLHSLSLQLNKGLELVAQPFLGRLLVGPIYRSAAAFQRELGVGSEMIDAGAAPGARRYKRADATVLYSNLSLPAALPTVLLCVSICY